jgi:hypothetical protein
MRGFSVGRHHQGRRRSSRRMPASLGAARSGVEITDIAAYSAQWIVTKPRPCSVTISTAVATSSTTTRGIPSAR